MRRLESLLYYKSMKSYYPKESLKKHYTIVGFGSIIAAIIVFILIPIGKIDNVQKIAFIGMLIGLPYLYVTRNKRVVLTIDREEITFNDGLLSRVRVPLDAIVYVEYHPDLKIRLKTNKKRKTVAIANVFSLEDQKEILDELKRRRHRIEIRYLERPNTVVTKGDKE